MLALREVIPAQTGERGAVTVSGTVIEIRSPLIKGDAGTIEKVYVFVAPLSSQLFTIEAEMKFLGIFAEITTFVSI